jgi:hypothetical protein
VPVTGDPIDIGHGVTMWLRYEPGVDGPAGLRYDHPAPNGNECGGGVLFDLPGVREVLHVGAGAVWQVESLDPLTISPSLLCSCGHHGWIKQGRWVPA